ncbi:MAG TPA: chitobiase/beta-hexosaminidase C-terminal domain-containing protein [Candidatus Bathyarchaeia archaeon]|nr:chitobiase/beta-hexosaminidase C-terminal domain-containing protein [Candidatus Bathyarchaeia archaeon]
MKRTLVAVLAMVAGLSFTASALPPLNVNPEGYYFSRYVDDPTWPEELTGDPYELNDGYWGTLMDFLTGLDTDEIMFDCLNEECDTTTGDFKGCDDRQTVFDGVDMDGVLIRTMNPTYESIPDKAEMMLLATALDSNPAWVTVLEGAETTFVGFCDILNDLTDWGVLAANKTDMLGAFEVFCEKTAQVAKPTIAGVITYSATPSVTVTLSCGTLDAVIHYTTDGSAVDEGKPTYTEPVEVPGAVDETVVVKAKAYKTDMEPSKNADTKSFLLLATAPVVEPKDCGTWEWSEDMKKSADAEAKAFDGFVVGLDPAFLAAATTEPGLSTVTLPTARSIAGGPLIAATAGDLMGLPGMTDPPATDIATHIVMGTMTAAQIDAAYLGNTGAYIATIQAAIDGVNDYMTTVIFLPLIGAVGELIGTIAEDLTEVLKDDVQPITIVLDMHAKAFAALEALGEEMNMAWSAMLDSLLSDLLEQIPETELLPGAPEGGYTIPELCDLLGSDDALIGLAAGGGLNNMCLGLGLTAGAAACATAADVFAAGAVAMNAVEIPVMPILGAGKVDPPPLSPLGDYDGDGITNLDAYNLVMDAGGDYEDFVAAAGGGFWTTGNPDLPAVGLLGLAALVSVIAAGGAFVLRKK